MEGPQSNEDMFHHKPLKRGRQIRLIHLETPQNNSKPLRCQIKEVCLDDNPEYSAMSYAWDAEIPTIPLICGGNTLFITPNCERGLRRFAKIPAGQVMWVDSICIDQASTSERNHQVNLMGAIYSQAATVLVWLGEVDEKTSYGFDQLRNLGEHGTSAERASQAFRDEEIAKRTDMIPLLFERSWFQRMWVVQEVSLPNPNQVLVFCGNTYIRWKHFIRGVLKFGELSASGIPECMDVFIYLHGLFGPNRRFAGAEHDHHVSKPVRQTIPLQVRRPLTILLSKAMPKKCQDRRDRIFALNSVFRALPIRVTANVPDPNYHKSYHEVETEIQNWISQIEGEGIAGIEILKIACPQGYSAISKSHVEVIGIPFPSIPIVVRGKLSERWVRSRPKVPPERRRELLFDDDIFPAFIEESRSCWMMGRWINAILDVAFAEFEVDEFRAKRNLPLSCTRKLQKIFSKLCPFLVGTGQGIYDFQDWANIVFSVHDSDFSALTEAVSEHATRASGMILIDRWIKCGHWWKTVGPLNTRLIETHTQMMECCNGKSLFVSREGDVLCFKVQRIRNTNKREDRPTFLVHFQHSAIVTVLQEFEWTWAEGQLKLCYDILANSDLARQAGHGGLALAGSWLGYSPLPELFREEIDKVVYIPKEEVLPDPVVKKGGNRGTKRDNRDAMSNRLSNVDMTVTRAGEVISYGSEDAFNAWWPSWFL